MSSNRGSVWFAPRTKARARQLVVSGNRLGIVAGVLVDLVGR